MSLSSLKRSADDSSDSDSDDSSVVRTPSKRHKKQKISSVKRYASDSSSDDESSSDEPWNDETSVNSAFRQIREESGDTPHLSSAFRELKPSEQMSQRIIKGLSKGQPKKGKQSKKDKGQG